MHKIHRRFIMKKFFALLLVVLMLVPFIASCKQPSGDTDTDTNSAPTDTNVDTSTDSGTKPETPDNKKDVDATLKNNYKNAVVNVMAPTWSGGVAGSPWSQVELCVTNWDKNANGFGQKINNAVMERKEYIEDTYQITVNWISCQGAGMLNRLTTAIELKNETIHVAIPHVYEAMQIVTQNALYKMNGDYINFDASYYNKESVENYTLSGTTFFAGGDISFLDDQTAYVLFFNNTVAEEFGDAFPDLYAATLGGTWTVDLLYDLAGSVSQNVDNNDEYTDNDKYGLGTTQLSCYYQYFGVYQVGKGKDGNNNEVFSLTIENDKVETIIEKMLFAKKNKDSIRTSWGSANEDSWTALGRAFSENRLLFYHEVLQKVLNFKNDLKVGVLPFPKLTTAQDRYYVPIAGQATVVCIPRATDDRVLSECMVEVLSKTAAQFITPKYLEEIKSHLHKDYVDNSMKVIKEQILPNLMYDLGYMYGRYEGDGEGLVTSAIQSDSITGNVNNFVNALTQGRTKADDMLALWSFAYNMYDKN